MNLAVASEHDYVALTAPDAVRVERLLPGPIERVWDYLTDSELRGRWICSGELEPRVGGRIDLVFRHATLTENDDPPPPKFAQFENEARMQGTITAYEPPRVLAYTWGEGEAPSHVRFDLAPQGEQVRLVVTHTRLASREDLLMVSAGWHTHLDILRDRLQGRTPAGFWRTYMQREAEYIKRLAD